MKVKLAAKQRCPAWCTQSDYADLAKGIIEGFSKDMKHSEHFHGPLYRVTIRRVGEEKDPGWYPAQRSISFDYWLPKCCEVCVGWYVPDAAEVLAWIASGAPYEAPYDDCAPCRRIGRFFTADELKELGEVR